MKYLVFVVFLTQTGLAQTPGSFIEPEQNFLRSALIVSEKPANRVRRGVLLPLGHDLWTCFDPDLLRYAAIWKAPAGQPPLTMDSMAGVSYPNEKAKADKVPALRGDLISAAPELPGVGSPTLPETDIRKGELLSGKGKVGPLPSENARWLGLELWGKEVVLRYRIGTRQIMESSCATSPDQIQRLIRVAPGKETVTIDIGAKLGAFDPNSDDKMPPVSVEGTGTIKIVSGSSKVTIAPSEKVVQVTIIRSSRIGDKEDPPRKFPEKSPATPSFPGQVTAINPNPKKSTSPITGRDLTIPSENPWKRTIRPTDIAFLSNGEALITTLDGDVWRVSNIETKTATWSRAAFGLFESMSIAINAKDEVFTLGRDQITKLEDTNGDGVFDRYLCASDAFRQTLHTRDYATSLELEPDGSFIIARSGLTDGARADIRENTADRGSILKIFPDGDTMTTLADGLRVPFVGLRSDGTIFVSDQQGNFIPSTPVHIITKDIPYLGYAPSNFRKKTVPSPPLLWFPYMINRSGASFAVLSEKTFPSLGNAFAHLSWSGRIFPIVTPDIGLPFAWKLPADFDFPILGAATQPTTGKLFVTGIGISGYKPTTAKEIGLAEISEQAPIAAPSSLVVGKNLLTLTFRSPLPTGLSLITPRPELDLWDIQRTPEYGSGHFRWDGKPGEHSIPTGELTLSPDRKSLKIATPDIFRSEILRLRIHFADTVSGNSSYDLEIYARPDNLSKASPSDLAALAKREKTTIATLVPGNPQRGASLFTNYGCVGCHSLTGEKLIGPPLNGIATRHPKNLEAYLEESILNPTAVITEGYEPSMPAFVGVIPDQDIAHLISYLKTLR